MIKQRTSPTLLAATSDAAYFLKNDTRQPMASPPWENFTAFVGSETGAGCRHLFKEMPKKMCPSCLPLQICYGKQLYRVWKLQNVGAVYESLTLARTKKNAGVIWNTLICIHSAHTLKFANASRLKTVFVQTRQS